MKNQQKAFIVTTGPDGAAGLDELNDALGKGWHVVQVAPMGGAGVGNSLAPPLPLFAALVVLEQAARSVEEVLEQVQEETEALLENGDLIGGEVMEGDGAGGDLNAVLR